MCLVHLVVRLASGGGHPAVPGATLPSPPGLRLGVGETERGGDPARGPAPGTPDAPPAAPGESAGPSAGGGGEGPGAGGPGTRGGPV